ncbi:TetR/AcrR family transcriptional regulator [Frankia sp. CNm7]|uniref:TetR/AcrR family transcriptional regulator n=1 Tax=Frankia nepalensis TaxID=1836974 RepID=A0A937RJU8_9ACTN|nr:TetR/AcrR family transcriptional regulator [Frankia nepalensis]MBL7500643.1 TetR/AcrR family transcriptional regulator [Frankia nepalensis]MBL7511396.1 TetR/AcrR family transcriptional regulator [Frankia nepalensis]MBL7521771.1 TetR/AcrR family transcriptional regulator [Frankia nepalensis]MBL7631492.1 TetR/AcrR family transcriptional regulator [Frankia nepalensis]
MTTPVPAPAATATPTGTRERLLDTAAPLFYREGVGIGVEALCRAAGVSKRSMYQLFASKDALIAASLDRWAQALRARLFPAADDLRPPRERILDVFERLADASADPDFRGCPFVGTAVEVKDPAHPAAAVARRHKQALTDFFAAEAGRAGAQDPALLAERLTLIYDGASARAVVRAEPLGDLAITTAALLLDTAGVPAAGGEGIHQGAGPAKGFAPPRRPT